MTDTMDLPHPGEGSHPTAPASTAEAGGLDTQLRLTLEELDRARTAQRGEFYFRIAVAVLGAGALAVVSGLAMVGVLGPGLRDLNIVAYAMPPLAAAVLLGLWASLPGRRYVADFKQQVLPAIAGALGDFHYDATGKITPQRLTGSTLLPSHEEYHSEDLFFGHYKGVEVALAEVKLTREQGSGKDRKTITAFKGLFALLSMQKAVAGKTVVRRESGAVANWLGGTFGGMEQFVPEDLAFDNRFDVYTSDQAEARQLLTPALLERLTTLAGHLGGGSLQAAFYDDQFFIMVPNPKDLFEAPSIFTSMHKNAGVNRIAGEFRDVLAMIDGLSQDERTVL